ncbi:oxygenase MpaB family protein [Subtercola endophyticus]|uniref:oxygenase MpaB family protein n=1 Tax=Subtercola endophyticus TaxID=2895559 RepID=UPI001E5D5F70|nr:oxygenase MpaB family protein [Subtercola endophyticus]UFS59390.1 DUF2236 domain-containing protein [Subtercola endophyticus]
MSVFTDLAAEAVLLAGGGRAILLQIADPAVGAGVARHSDFANRPLDRFANTVTYAYATVFGTPAELRAVIDRVNRAHGPVHSPRSRRTATVGAAPVTGAAAYDAFDAAKQLWVAATLYQSAATVYEKVFGALDADDAEDVYQQYAVLGTALQVPRRLWPATLADFDVYWADAVAALAVSDDARRVASDLLHPRTAPPWLRVVMPLVRLVTTGLLTPELRRAFVLPWNERRQRRFDRVFALASVVYPHLPQMLRHLPRDRYMARLRRSLA